MRQSISKILLPLSVFGFMLSFVLMLRRVEPFYTFFYLISWWTFIPALDSWLYMKGGESLLLEKPGVFFSFLVPLSALIWFIFEAFNLRLHNWHYIGVPSNIFVRWPGYFLAFGTVLPGIFLTANALEKNNVFPKNEFSLFFTEELPKSFFYGCTALGTAMLALPLARPEIFFPCVWGGFFFLLDPWVAKWSGKSLLQEWRQKNFNRTLQLLLAGFICGGLWEFWNFWAGAKWVYTLPSWVVPRAADASPQRMFEMPVLGFIGFPPFALECFVMTEFTKCLKDRAAPAAWKLGWATAFLFMAWMCRRLDLHTVFSYG